MFRQFLLTRATDFCPLYTAENVSFWRNNIYINILDSEFGACLHFRIIIVFKISCETFEPSLSVSVTDAAAAAVIAVMLNEDKFSRPRPRTNRRGRGQTFEAEDEAKTMRPRPRPIFQDQRSPLILLCLRHELSSISMSHPYCHLSVSSSIIVCGCRIECFTIDDSQVSVELL